MTTANTNPVGLAGISFVEFASRDPERMHRLFHAFGFSLTHRHASLPVDMYEQGDIVLLLSRTPTSHAAAFEKAHGPSIVSMGWNSTHAPAKAMDVAVTRGARGAVGDYDWKGSKLSAIYGIGDSLIYFTPAGERPYEAMGFVKLETPVVAKDHGFRIVDHMTNNVFKGTMKQWSDFYKEVFGFTEVRYFDIRGAKTGLTSYALRSPCGLFCIPINEGTEAKSQINEYLEEYHGPGVQHLAFGTDDLVASMDSLKTVAEGLIEFLDIDDEYYQDVFERVPGVTEDHDKIKQHMILVDGDADGYLLQIFTRNLVGPIFIELIQRHNNLSFGEGNFGALFRSIERDQIRRGFLQA